MRASAILIGFAATLTLPGATVQAAATTDELLAICAANIASVFGVPNGEPLGACQWDMALINAGDLKSYAHATGKGVTVGGIRVTWGVGRPQPAARIRTANAAANNQ